MTEMTSPQAEEEPNTENPTGEVDSQQAEASHRTIQLSGMYENWFLDYASYVILDRAVPDVFDGLKPVQRRILHAMKSLDDGRYNKVANIIGHTMQYHPHGDASIGDALVQLGQKDLLIDTQGNWGNILTGDSAAAPRYIEARLSKFALAVVFNPKTTEWKASYDGRNNEPVNLPMKFPLLLAQGVEGIAVGLASKILPHNFIELIDASISYLKGEEFELVPDFPTGGMADFSRYNNGLRGGKVRVRAKISQQDKKTLMITELPYATNTSSLIESIITANDKGKIRIKKIDDNTAQHVEILIHLNNGVSPDQTIDALYAFTNCEISISPNACIIENERPVFMGVHEILKVTANRTRELLKRELEIRKNELMEQLHFASLEKIFIENRIYHDIEEAESWDEVLSIIRQGLEPYTRNFYREITEDDLARLTEIKIKRISKYNTFKADELVKNLQAEVEEVENHLNHLTDYAINYYRQIKKRFGKGRERKTEIRSFDTIEATMVAAATQKLYVNREEGFIGTSLKKDEYVGDCSDIDDIIAFRSDGKFQVVKVANKAFVGPGIIHVAVFQKNDERTIYNLIYQDGKGGLCRAKRFAVKGITREKEYDLTRGTAGSRIMYFTANPNGEAEVLKIHLRPKPRLKKLSFDFDFSELAIKGRGSQGNIITKNSVRKIVQKEEGVSTLGARDIYYDDTVSRLNTEERGKYLGAFKGDDKILVITASGHYRTLGYDLAIHFDEDMIHIEKFDSQKVISVVYYNGDKGHYYLKRFLPELSDKKMEMIGDHSKSKMMLFSFDYLPVLKMIFDAKANAKELEDEVVEVAEFIDVKGYKAKGKRLSTAVVKQLKWLESKPYTKPEPEAVEEEEGGMADEVVEETPSPTARKQDEEASSAQEATDAKNGTDSGEEDLPQLEIEF